MESRACLVVCSFMFRFVDMGGALRSFEDDTVVGCPSTAGFEKPEAFRVLVDPPPGPAAAADAVTMACTVKGLKWLWLAFFAAPPGPGVWVCHKGVYAVASDGVTGYADGAGSRKSLPGFVAGDHLCVRYVRAGPAVGHIGEQRALRCIVRKHRA